jgi:D-alanyl-D-alanine carboxypeptidase
MSRLPIALLAAAALVAAAVVVWSRETSSELERAASGLVATGVPGVLLRVREGDEVREVAAGEATNGARFRVASVTKTFVAALTLRLADRGVLSLDDPISRYEPGLVRDAGGITIRELLSHRAGLFDYTSDPQLLRGERSPRELVRIADGKPRTPGYAYSSTNYLALGVVLERATGEPLAALLRRLVFRPSGLRETAFEPGPVRGPSLHGHERASRQGVATGTLRDTSSRSARSAWAAGAIVSSATDLDRFFTWLSSSGLARRMRPPAGERYGLGLARFLQTPCGPLVGHTGNLLGTITVVWTRAERLLVLAANVYPLTPEQESELEGLLGRAFCGQ